MKYVDVAVSLFILGFCGAVWWGVLGVGKSETPRKEIKVAHVIPTPSEQIRSVTLMAVGDVMLSRSVLEQMQQRQDYKWPFGNTAETLKVADLTIGNLETPIAESCPPMTNRMIFCAPKEVTAGLTVAGFDLLSLENNHALNMGVTGKTATEAILQGAGVDGLTGEKLVVRNEKGLKIGFLALDDISRQLDQDLMGQQVASAAARVDILVGVIHWGVEYTSEPTERQKSLGHRLVDSGMKIVIGSHPHWVQPVEKYHDGLIFYSLGNFVFDQMWSEETRQGEVVKVNLPGLDYELLPVRIYDYGQPRLGQ